MFVNRKGIIVAALSVALAGLSNIAARSRK